MNEPWKAEFDITPLLASRLIYGQFPFLAGLPIAELTSGWDNAAFLVDGQWVFRFPRRQIAVGLVLKEIRSLPALASRLPLSIPNPVHVGVAGTEYPYPFAGYRLIAGTTACRVDLNDGERTAIAEPLAGFLRILHAIPHGEALELGIGGDVIHRLDVDHHAPAACQRIDRMVQRGDATAVQADALRGCLAEAAVARVPRVTTLVHGDLYVRHLVLDELHCLSGIIDWGDLHLGDQAMDLMIAYLVLPATARRRFFSVYGSIDEDTRRLARFRGAVHLGHLLDFAHATRDQALRDEMRREIRNLIDEDPNLS
jgi:aminoglycoside phosphotransferase (APT) family kinase protein